MSERRFEVETWLSDENQTVSYVVLDGLGDRVVNEKSTTTYEVVSGVGTFMIGCASLPVESGSVVTVPSGTVYQDEGKSLTMLATSIPPFDPTAVTVINGR